MLGRLLCNLGLHKVVTTREGKNSRSSAASFIHCHCYRPGCDFHVIVDTHSGQKHQTSRTNGAV